MWDRWRQEFGLTGFSFDDDSSDYGIAGLNMTACTSDVRRRMNIHTPTPQEINDNNRYFETGCRAVGVSTRLFELNMKECLGCGYCAEGCAYDRKQGTMITYIADALSRGVQLVHHCKIDAIDFEKRTGILTAVGAKARVRTTARGSRPNSVPAGDVQIWRFLSLRRKPGRIRCINRWYFHGEPVRMTVLVWCRKPAGEAS